MKLAMIRKLTSLTLAACVVLAFSSCDNVLDVNPGQAVPADGALQTQLDFEALLTSVYDRLQGLNHYGQEYILYPGALADNIQNTTDNSNRYPFVERNDIGTHLADAYEEIYAAINETNFILAQVGELVVQGVSDEEEQAIRDRIRGEALFLRALNYFDLVRTHAYEPGLEVDGFDLGVIIRTEPTQTIEDIDFRPRATNAEVYDLIEADLRQAIDLLEGQSLSQFRANHAAAQALLARVNLYRGFGESGAWAEAEQFATGAMNDAGNVGAGLVPAAVYVDAWVVEASHPGSLFELNMEPNQDGDVTGFNESLNSLTTPAGWGDLIPPPALLAAHVEGDVRLDLYEFFPDFKGGQTYIQKWVANKGVYTHNIPLIRYSELLLIRAEARAMQNELAEAVVDLSTLREARGLEPLPGGMSQQEVIDEVLRQRRIEFAFEGHRFFDLKRRGLDINKAPTQTGTDVPYEAFIVLAPFPTQQVDINPELTQNPGY